MFKFIEVRDPKSLMVFGDLGFFIRFPLAEKRDYMDTDGSSCQLFGTLLAVSGCLMK